MHSLIEKFTPETVEVADDDGVVAIEYVLMAGLVAVGVGVTLATTGIWTTMLGKLNSLFGA